MENQVVPMEKYWKWMLFAGVLFVILGFIAFSMPIASTVGLTFGLAGLLLAGGIIQLVQAFQLRRHPGNAGRFFRSALNIVIGAMMFRYPEGGLMGVALALSIYFLFNAVSQWILFYSMRPMPGLGWGIVSSIASLILGVYILITFPFSALWVPGALLGIDLLFSGSSMIGFAFSLRRMDTSLSSRSTSTLRPSRA
jgi:uncharacterized membrane protein HdeD (DUF308 family)